MSDAEIDGNEVEPEAEREAGSGGLRKAMEQRVKSLQDAEERIRREQAALQEQAGRFASASRAGTPRARTGQARSRADGQRGTPTARAPT
jgi:hypothetical protein